MMRFVLLAATACLLAACGGSEDGQANSAQVNVDNSASPPPTAVATTVNSPTGKAVSGDEAKRIMHERHEGMEGMGKAVKSIGRELKSGSPNIEAIRSSAKAITDFAPHVASLFPPGTGPEAGKTGAKPEIWQNPQDFTAKAGDFQKAAQGFGGAVQGNDLATIKARFADLGGTCKGCHDKYRSEMKH